MTRLPFNGLHGMSFADADALRAYAAAKERAGVQPDDARLRRVLEAHWVAFHHDPLLRRYVKHLDSPNARNTEPWQAEGERRYATVLALAVSTGEVVCQPSLTDNPVQDAITLVFRLSAAVPYLWTNAIDELVLCSPPLPPHVISRAVLPYPYMFWSRETAASGGGAYDAETNWILVSDEGAHMAWTLDSKEPGQQATAIMGMSCAYGKHWPEDFTAEEQPAVEAMLKRLAFLNSPYIRAERGHLSRPVRRELQRHGVAAPEKLDPEIYVVVLRRDMPHPAEPHPDRLEGPEWKHHWWVSGHYKRQWYESEQAHHVIWISPYLKGDLDKPLLEKVYHVVR